MRQFSNDAMQLGIPLARLARLLGVPASSLHRWSKATKVTQGYLLVLDKLDLLHSVAEGSQKFRLQTDEEIIERMRKQLTKEIGVEDPDEKERKIIQIRESRKLIAEEAKRLRGIIHALKEKVRQAKENLTSRIPGNRESAPRRLAESSTKLAAAETELATLLATGQLPPEPPPTPAVPVYSPEYSIDVEPADPSPEPREPSTDPRQPPLRLTPDDAWTPHSYTPEQLDYLNSRYNPYIDYDGVEYYREDPGGPDQPPGPWQVGGFYTRKGYPLPDQFWADVF